MSDKNTPKAIVLLSGGLDSSTCLAIAQSKGFDVYALSFSYGQKHSSELEAAKRVANLSQVSEHRIINLDLGGFGGSALTDEGIEVPTENDPDNSDEIPATYVPARNTVFLSIALAWAEVLEAEKIFAGVNAVDYSGYPDCRPEYIEAFQKMADLATKAGIEGTGVKIETPLINLTKPKIIQLGLSLAVDYSQTVSCYQADEHGLACGQCDSCLIRKAAFESAGIADPTRYR
ncbi:7-cyano-7-deazaguanine synthase QueC [Aliikangiella marina]|uniref:7-cyano-7-deazaguanine synthase n=1 Tax=Aliikangiella marina TaxID=1712262 RepID=A0A545TD19_9GAMM|nr:7-cyano-7-deazaguanine synthase QueC [Aliikangiella marina]TQV75109.1 7-cyano-7-deazaguanine synthase QueC [Aliikangiella marina]